jgi:hypothetical protein
MNNMNDDKLSTGVLLVYATVFRTAERTSTSDSLTGQYSNLLL